jgi:hypothetical protein
VGLVTVANTPQALQAFAAGATVDSQQTWQTAANSSINQAVLSVATEVGGLSLLEQTITAHNAVMLAMLAGETFSTTDGGASYGAGSLTGTLTMWNLLAAAYDEYAAGGSSNPANFGGSYASDAANPQGYSAQNILAWVDNWAIANGYTVNPILAGGALANADADRATNGKTTPFSVASGIITQIPYIGPAAGAFLSASGATAAQSAISQSAAQSQSQLQALNAAGDPLPSAASILSGIPNSYLLGAAAAILLVVVFVK